MFEKQKEEQRIFGMNPIFRKLLASAIILFPALLSGAIYLDARRESWKRAKSISGTLLGVFILVWIAFMARIWR